MPAIADRAVWEKITKERARIRWDIWKDFGRDQEEVPWYCLWRSLKNKVKEEKHLEIYGGLMEDIGIKTFLHGPMDYANKLKLRFRVGDLDLPERRKRYTSSREEEDVATHTCPFRTTIESRTDIVGGCEIYKEDRDALEKEMRKLNVYDMEEFGRLEGSEKTVAILGARWWPQTAKQEGDRISKQFFMYYGRSVMSAQILEVSLLGVGTVLRLERDAWSMIK